MQQFGGAWTEAKLEVVRKYLNAYWTIMRKNQKARHFHVTYVDGFAGSGRRYASRAESGDLFEEFADEETQEFFPGSAYYALVSDPPFDRYVFIESKPQHAEELTKLIQSIPDRSGRSLVLREDANKAVKEFCRDMRPSDRALMFLDPYGMQVSWETMQAIARTKKIDVWVLVPLGVALLRLITAKSPPAEWADSLTRFFGTEDWKSVCYEKRVSTTLFGDEESESRVATAERLTEFFVERMNVLFEGVLQTPIVLRSKTGNPLYLLCFAAGHPRGAPTAVRIAGDIARSLST